MPASTTLTNLWQLILKYGPYVVKWLIDQGIIKLPGGGTLPTLPFHKVPAIGSAEQQALDIEVEYDQVGHARALHHQMGVVLT